MSFSGRKRSCSAIYTYLVFLLAISCFYTWASTNCKVEALRILQEEQQAYEDAKKLLSTQDDQEKKRKITSEADHFREFFNAKVAQDSDLNNNNNNTTDSNKGFQEDKRRVPSCPDPLHN